MTSAPPPGGPSWHHEPAASHPAGPPASSSFFRWLRGLDITRAPDRWVGGVAGGVARRTGLDIALVRGLIVILAVFGGIGVLLYGLAWALLPEPDGRIHVEQAGRGSWTSGLTGAAAFVAIGLWRPNLPLLDGGGTGGLLWTLFWIGAVVLFVYWIINRSTGGQARRDLRGGPSDPDGPGKGPSPSPGPGTVPGAPGRPDPTGPPSTDSDGEGHAAGRAAGSDRRSPDDDPPASSTASAASSAARLGSVGSVTERIGGTDGAADEGEGEDADDASDDAVHRTVPLPYRPGAYASADAWTQQAHPTQPLPYDPGPSSWSGSTYPASYPGPVAGPPPATRFRPPRPSGPATALLIGGALVVGATLLALDYVGSLALADPVVVALAAASIVLALGVIGLGAWGRTSGLVGFAAALAVIGALLASFTIGGGAWIVAQESRIGPASPQTASNGYSVLAAQATIDLTRMPPLSRDVVVPVNSLAGAVTVVVPYDVPVEVRTRMALGSVGTGGTLEGPDGSSAEPQSEGGVLQVQNGTLNPDATGSAIILDVRGAMSDVRILTAPGPGDPSPNSSPNPTGDTP